MSRSKKATRSKGIVTSYSKKNEILQRARSQETFLEPNLSEEITDYLELRSEATSNLSKNLTTESSSNRVSQALKENSTLALHAKEVEEGIPLLPGKMVSLFELTRDGKKTPEWQREEILKDPEISSDDIFNAVKLGIKAWGVSIFPERRV